MATIFERATPEDFDEIVDLANYVFSYSGTRHDFPTLLPKLYKREYGSAVHHFVAREEGGIKAVVGAFPMSMMVAGEKLLVFGIGSVCVHPYRRHLGYMNALMKMSHDAIRASGADFGCLGGQRQRYQYFGYDRCGQSIHFSFNKANVRHRYGSGNFPEWSFRLLKADDAILPQCREWFELRPAYVVRKPDAFYDIQMTWNSAMWCILLEGKPCGYLTASGDGTEVHELVMGIDREPAEVLSAWLVQQKINEVRFAMPPFDQKGIASLSSLCENARLETADNLSIFNFPGTVRAFLKLKAGYSPLPDGSLVIAVEGRTPFSITVAEGTVLVGESEEPANLALPYMDALALLFGPFGGVASVAIETRCAAGPAGWSERERALARAWFPLPLFFDSLDNV